MPLSRYQIRNEYSLADPDLYRAADKDDPEALLEGVAMAGLVGVLRQLGDLAEFAAEIFHDLHEEVMATAARGHNLMVRVQQLEAEFPAIEKAFLSQTSQSSFYYSAGINWHPNMRMDQNLITQGDLPRFIMDSYEECRGPPRLFLLDKFDVAGAGACLKRYTDPSVFKVETSYSAITTADGLREKKPRKAKKKGSRWRNGETPETLTTSHAKLHQLFLEERVENGTNDSARRVKLKRRLNGFPFDSRSGKSYMENFLKSPLPDHEEVHEIPVDSSPLALPYSSTYESEIVEISTVSPEKESKAMRSPPSSPTRKGTKLEAAIDELNEVPSPKGIFVVSKSNPDLEANDISTNIHKGVTEKEISVDGGIKTEGSIDEYQFDDVLSEIDNYVDALTTMESEMDTDSELRSKNNLHYLNGRRQASDLDADGEQVHDHSSDSLSMGNSTLSDDGNSSSKKDLSSFSYSDSHSISAETTPSDGEISSNVFRSNEIHEAEEPSQQSIGEGGQISKHPGGAVSDGAFTETVEIPIHSSKLGDPTASSSPSDSDPVDKNEEAVVKEVASVVPETDEMVARVSMDPPLVSSTDVWQQEGDYLSPYMSGDNQHMDEFEDENTNSTANLGCTSYISVPSLSKDGFPFQASAENKFDGELEDDGNQQEDLPSTSDCVVVPHAMNENPSLLPNQSEPLPELHDEYPNWMDKLSSSSNPSNTLLQNREDLSPKMSSKTLPVDNSGVEHPNFLLDALVCVSDTVDADTQKKITENVLVIVPQIGRAECNLVPNSVENPIDPLNLDMTLTEDQPIDPMRSELETQYSKLDPVDTVFEIEDSIPSAGERAENVIFKEDVPIICESVESFVSGTTADIPPLGPSKERTLYLSGEYFDEPTNLGDSAVMDEATSYPDLLDEYATSEPSLVAGVLAHLDEVDHELLNVPNTFADHDGSAVEDIDGASSVEDIDGASSVDPKKLQEGPLLSVVDEHNGLEAETCLLDRPRESDVTEVVYDQKLASLDLNSLCNKVTSDDSGIQACSASSDTYIVSEASSSLNSGDAPTCHQLSVEQNEEELEHLEEKFDLLPQEHEEELLNGVEANSELLNQWQQTHHLIHDDQVGLLDASSKSSLVNIPSQPSASEILPQGSNMTDVSEHLLDPSSSIFSGFSLLTNSSQIYVEEMPPLPPLPPVQWRMGKFQHANQAPERVSTRHSATAFPPLLPSNSIQEAQPLTSLLPPPVSPHEMSTTVCEQPICNTGPFISQVAPLVHDGDSKDNILPPEGTECTSTSLQSSGSHGEMLQNDFQAGEGENLQTNLDSSHACAMDAASADTWALSHEEAVKLEDMELGQGSGHSEDNVMTCHTTELPSNVSNEHTMPTSEENLSWPSAEDGKLHGVRMVKLLRPRNPLIDAVAAHDKSKLRKVTERVRPQIQKEDERDSLLKQIRTKSFNLKPAVVTRPSIQGPKTNLKVAAILEKAKTIRQAFVGSDEEDDDDDDDSWSDS
ncbi:hypothetical protein ACH5RR_005044 [Cinchona calisaya]|uniref:Protein SCAR n=1 Tax=Cinchona calisaya TaxID=153742 RepID=A0ABD3AZX8_9GENT